MHHRHKPEQKLGKAILTLCITIAISACSTATSTISSIGSIGSAISATEQTEPEQKQVESSAEPAPPTPPEKPPILEDEDCQFEYTFTADYQSGGGTACEMIIISEVDDVIVSVEESRRRYEQLWSSRPTTHTLVREDCENERVRLSKRYYPTQQCSLDFNRGNRATLRLSASEWLKFGWVRVDYYSGDLDFVDVDGLSEPYTLLKGSHISERIPLGDHNLTISGMHKAERDVLVQIWKEDHMRAVVIDSVGPGNGIRTLTGEVRTLRNGYGELKVVTELDGVRFDIASEQNADMKACLRNPTTGQLYDCVPFTNLMAPNTYAIPAGDYKLYYRGKALEFVVEESEEYIIMLGEAATLL
mgnify:CR=1 FL=1